jgi:sugar/nucleoside kinase (ribokinase family)
VNLTISLLKIFKMKRILGIGNALVDIMTLINDDNILEKFALPKGSMQLVDKGKSETVKAGTAGFKRALASGGSAANTIHGLAMLGLSPGFIGSVGKDETGDYFEKEMKRAGVETILLRRNNITGTAVALISPDSERTFATHLGAATELEADDLDPKYFEGFDILYIEGYLIYNKPLVEKICRLAKERNMKIAIDLASFNVVKTHLDAFKEIITDYADIVFANEEEAKAFTGQPISEALKIISGMCEIAVIKTGAEGSLIQSGEKKVRIESLPVKCLDTTGAGDLYASGFLYGYADGLDLDKCGLLGALLAGNVIETIGARIIDNRWAEIRKKIGSIINE